MTLYSIGPSPPGAAARAMLEHQGLPHRVVQIPPGFHPPFLRARGFRGNTVPALLDGGQRVQGSLRISRHLDAVAPERALFPSDPALRSRAEEAEAWGEGELQAVARRPMRWLLASRVEARVWIAREHLPLPGSTVLARPSVQAKLFARAVGATAEAVRADLASIPEHLDRVEALLDEGVIGGHERNAADFQLASCVLALLAFPELEERFGNGRAAMWAREVLPVFPPSPPRLLPPEWLPPA